MVHSVGVPCAGKVSKLCMSTCYSYLTRFTLNILLGHISLSLPNFSTLWISFGVFGLRYTFGGDDQGYMCSSLLLFFFFFSHFEVTLLLHVFMYIFVYFICLACLIFCVIITVIFYIC